MHKYSPPVTFRLDGGTLPPVAPIPLSFRWVDDVRVCVGLDDGFLKGKFGSTMFREKWRFMTNVNLLLHKM